MVNSDIYATQIYDHALIIATYRQDMVIDLRLELKILDKSFLGVADIKKILER